MIGSLLRSQPPTVSTLPGGGGAPLGPRAPPRTYLLQLYQVQTVGAKRTHVECKQIERESFLSHKRTVGAFGHTV